MNILTSIKTEKIEFLGYELTFHILDNGKKVVELKDVDGLFGYINENNITLTSEDISTLAQWLEGFE